MNVWNETIGGGAVALLADCPQCGSETGWDPTVPPRCGTRSVSLRAVCDRCGIRWTIEVKFTERTPDIRAGKRLRRRVELGGAA